MNSKRHLSLGLFFIVVIGILAYFTLTQSNFSLFSDVTRMSVYFEETNGLREGDPVLVAGMRWGKVESLEFDPAADRKDRIEVVFTLTTPVALKNDCAVTIEDATLLGGKNLAIEPGSAASPARSTDLPLYGKVEANVLDALGELVEENRAALSGTLSGLEAIVGDVQSGRGLVGRLVYNEELANTFSDALVNIAETFENTSALTADVRAGKGTIGRLFVEDAVYLQIERITADLSGILTDVREGRGTVGSLIYDEALAADVDAAVKNIRQITDDINSGKGTLGRLVGDGAIADDIETITSRLADGQGTLGRLLVEDEIYVDLREIADNLAVATAALAEGEGTLGRLVMDDELYRELQRAMTTLTGTLEEAREAAPIATFLSTVFLGF